MFDTSLSERSKKIEKMKKTNNNKSEKLFFRETVFHGQKAFLFFKTVVGNHRAAARCRSVRSSLPGRIIFQVKCFETFL